MIGTIVAANNAPTTPPAPVVTGGTLYTGGGYNYRVFTADGTLGVSTAALTADVLVVAGGASGGAGAGGGAGVGGDAEPVGLVTSRERVIVRLTGGDGERGVRDPQARAAEVDFDADAHRGGRRV